MLTPQQIDEIAFSKATFGGYKMEDVDEFLEPLTEDYVTLYKENALLKSKMRVLVGKLEEYRKNEAGMKDAIVNAQKTCDKMVREAEANNRNTDALIAAENARVDEARQAAAQKISQLQEQLNSCIQALERIKNANAPVAPKAEAPVIDQGDAQVADEIAQSLAALVGTTNDSAPKAEPKHPVHESTTSRFANLNLQFGRNYDVNHK